MAAATANAPTSAIGSAAPSSTGFWDAPDQYESTPELRWPLSVAVFDSMRRTDSQVQSVLRAVTLPVRRTKWSIDGTGCRPEVNELVSQDLGLPILGQEAAPRPLRTKDRFSWQEHLQQALLCLPFGHSFFEQQYRYDAAGMARLRKLGPRLPRTISAIHTASDGGLVSIEQYGAASPIPVARLVAYCNDREGGNWLGTSLLRAAYKHWLLKDRLLRVDSETIERNGMGVPRYTGPENPADNDLSEGKKLAQGWRSGNHAGAAVPFGAKLDLVGVTGTLPNALESIRYHDEQIARAVLAHFLNLGTQTGSWALGSTFADFFTLGLQTIAQLVADTANSHVVEDLVDINFGTDEPAPRIVFDEIGSRKAQDAAVIKYLVDAGVIFPDRTLEEFARRAYDLPAKESKTGTTPAAGGA